MLQYLTVIIINKYMIPQLHVGYVLICIMAESIAICLMLLNSGRIGLKGAKGNPEFF